MMIFFNLVGRFKENPTYIDNEIVVMVIPDARPHSYRCLDKRNVSEENLSNFMPVAEPLDIVSFINTVEDEPIHTIVEQVVVFYIFNVASYKKVITS